MSSLDTEFHRRLIKRIDEIETREVENMRTGALEFDMYKQKSGYLAAIRHVREIGQQIESDITEGK